MNSLEDYIAGVNMSGERETKFFIGIQFISLKNNQQAIPGQKIALVCGPSIVSKS